MHSVSTYLEIKKTKARLLVLQTQYNEALKADKPFRDTRKIFDEIKQTALQLEKLQAETPVQHHLINR